MNESEGLEVLGQLDLELPDHVKFDGETYEHEFDAERLRGQYRRVYKLMIDGTWRTLSEIEEVTRDPQASISARLRDFRKKRFGHHTVERQRRGDPTRGLFEYRLIK